jgi:chromosome segregation ATPase
MGKGKGSVGKVLKVVINAKLYEYKYFKLVAQEELAARMVGQVETADESSYMDEQDFLEQRLDEQANERALAAKAEKEAQRKAIVEVKAIILSEITQLNKELKKIKATKKALTTQRAACTAKLKQATDRLETQHRKMEKLNTKDE